MEESIRRYFLIVIGVIGAVLSAALIVTSLKTGKVPGPSLAWWVTDQGYSHASNPSQYGFMLFVFIVGFVGSHGSRGILIAISRAPNSSFQRTRYARR